jgi:membrane-associated phospholipid phosphatase
MTMNFEEVRRRPLTARTVVRLAVPAAYAVAATVVFVVNGIPLERGLLSVWILGGLLCLSLGNLRSFGRSLLLEWMPLLAALTLYDVARGAGGGELPVHALFQIDADRIAGIGSVPTVWLQAHLWDPSRTTWYDVAAWLTYMSYFLLTPVVLATFWLTDRPWFRAYARRLTLISFAAVTFFVLLPTMPPWLASDEGLIGPVDRLIGPIGRAFPWFDGSSLWESGLPLANDEAAFPSLHEGMTVLVVIMLWRRVPRWVRPLLAAYPVAMAFALVYSGEHYVTDLAAGVLLAFAVARLEPWATSRLRLSAAGRAVRQAGRAWTARSPRTDPPASPRGGHPRT